MAAVTRAGNTWDTTAGNKTVTATPAAGDLIVVIAATSGLAGGTISVTDNNSIDGGDTLDNFGGGTPISDNATLPAVLMGFGAT